MPKSTAAIAAVVVKTAWSFLVTSTLLTMSKTSDNKYALLVS